MIRRLRFYLTCGALYILTRMAPEELKTILSITSATSLKITKLWLKKNTVAYYTTDGKKLAPYPNMTDEQLEDFELDMNVPRKTNEQGGANG